MPTNYPKSGLVLPDPGQRNSDAVENSLYTTIDPLLQVSRATTASSTGGVIKVDDELRLNIDTTKMGFTENGELTFLNPEPVVLNDYPEVNVINPVNNQILANNGATALTNRDGQNITHSFATQIGTGVVPEGRVLITTGGTATNTWTSQALPTWVKDIATANGAYIDNPQDKDVLIYRSTPIGNRYANTPRDFASLVANVAYTALGDGHVLVNDLSSIVINAIPGFTGAVVDNPQDGDVLVWNDNLQRIENSSPQYIKMPSTGGVEFPQGVRIGSETAPIFDRYLEGTWTPGIGGATTRGTAASPAGAAGGCYCVVGNYCCAQGQVMWSSIVSGAGSLTLYDLPFISYNEQGNLRDFCFVELEGVVLPSGKTRAMLVVKPNSNTATIVGYGSNQAAVDCAIDPAGTIRFSLFYRIS